MHDPLPKREDIWPLISANRHAFDIDFSIRPFGLCGVAREVWGVTGACIATRRSVFFEIGGLNEALAISCNDVDFCVGLRASGMRIIWTSRAELEHREQASRGEDVTPEQQAIALAAVARLRREWGNLMRDDPHYPPGLDSCTELFPFFYPALPMAVLPQEQT
jgi:hypothetical protein